MIMRKKKILASSITIWTILILIIEFYPVYGSGFISIVGSSTIATANSTQLTGDLTCNTTGYFYVFWTDGTNLVYSSSVDGISWSAKTTAVAGITNVLGTSLWCDSSGNIYLSWTASATTFKYNTGTTSSGVITFGTAVTLTSTFGTTFTYPSSIFAYSITNVWIGLQTKNTGTGNSYSEIWSCQTSSCLSSANWSDKHSILNGGETVVIGGSATTNIEVTYLTSIPSGRPGTQSAIVTTNSGTTWSSPVTTGSSYDCETGAVNIGNTLYIVCINSTSAGSDVLSFASGAWTDKQLTTSELLCGISTDSSTNLIVFCIVSSSEVGYFISTNSGSTWGSLQVLISLTSTVYNVGNSGYPQVTPQMVNGFGCISYTQGTANPFNVMYGCNGAQSFTTTTTTTSTTTTTTTTTSTVTTTITVTNTTTITTTVTTTTTLTLTSTSTVTTTTTSTVTSTTTSTSTEYPDIPVDDNQFNPLYAALIVTIIMIFLTIFALRR